MRAAPAQALLGTEEAAGGVGAGAATAGAALRLDGGADPAPRRLEPAAPPSPDAARQQARFDLFRQEFNHERPHEALGQQTPASLYRASATPFREPPDDPAYPPDALLRRVRTSGEIKWNGTLQFLSEAIAGQTVGITRRPDGHWLVRYADVPVGLIDQHSARLARLGPGRPPRTQATPQT